MLYIMRHGKTDWNAMYKLQGRTDIPLNEEGRRMAASAREQYRGIHFDVCYCSPLVRARETAGIVLEGSGVPIVYDERLKEMCFGIYEGCEHIFEKPHLPIYTFFKDPAHNRGVEGGETFDELFARTGAFLREVVDPLLEQGKDVLVVGHGAMNSSIVCQVRGLPLDRFWDAGIENCRLMLLK